MFPSSPRSALCSCGLPLQCREPEPPLWRWWQLSWHGDGATGQGSVPTGTHISKDSVWELPLERQSELDVFFLFFGWLTSVRQNVRDGACECAEEHIANTWGMQMLTDRHFSCVSSSLPSVFSASVMTHAWGGIFSSACLQRGTDNCRPVGAPWAPAGQAQPATG